MNLGKAFRIEKSLAAILAAGLFVSCASIPEPKFTRYQFPRKDVFLDQPPATRKFTIVGQVRTKVDFASLNADIDERELCQNYYNKAARDLLRRAKREAKADAVAEVRSIVFFMDGTAKTFRTPECSDDGGEGQILLQGIAIQWVKDESPAPAAETGAPRDPIPAQKKKTKDST